MAQIDQTVRPADSSALQGPVGHSSALHFYEEGAVTVRRPSGAPANHLVDADTVTSLTRSDTDVWVPAAVLYRSTMAILLRQRICTVGSLSMVIGERLSPVLLPIVARAVDRRDDPFRPRLHNFLTTTSKRTEEG